MHLKRTKIVATISSLNCEVPLLQKLFQSGVNVVRLNTAHLNLDEAAMMVARVREVSDRIAILIDTKGPEVRSCNLAAPLAVKAGDLIKVSAEPVPAGEGFQVNYGNFAAEVKVGNRIVLDDGAIAMVVRENQRNKVLVCEVLNEGEIKNKKTVNVPGIEMNMPSLTLKDREFIEFAVKNNLDFIAHSFVRHRDDVLAVQSILDTYRSPIKIIAKIENRQGVKNLDSILDLAYGVMVARGDLGVEIPAEEVPLIQKQIIYECMVRCKPVITATQMLQSMIDNPRPTRAEVSDVANAVFDGTDAVMLSGETAQGRYPVESVQTMARIICQAESATKEHFTLPRRDIADSYPQRSYLIRCAMTSAEHLPVKAIVCSTDTGTAARLSAAYRATVPVMALSGNPTVVRQLALSYGVYASPCESFDNASQMVLRSAKILLDEGKIEPNDLVAVVGNYPLNHEGTNFFCVNTLESIIMAKKVE